MPIVIKWEENVYAPVVICDHCGERITEAKDGNHEWWAADAEQGAALYFTHKACCFAFEQAHGGRAGWYAGELQLLPVYLAANLKVDWKKAQELARDQI